jgi:hypothetical protein
MLAMLVQLIVQLVIGTVMLAVRIAMAIAHAFGVLLGTLIGALWRAWANRQFGKVPLRSSEFIGGETNGTPPSPRAPQAPSFTPRPMRPRPRR